MKAYKKLEIKVLQLEEEVIRTSVVSTAEDLNVFDDVFSFGSFSA